MAELVKDVVCGMDVDPDSAPAKSEHQGTTYYFCAEGCKTEFDAEPQKFLSGGAQPAAEAEPVSAAPAAAAAPAAEAAPAAASSDKRWWEFWK